MPKSEIHVSSVLVLRVRLGCQPDWIVMGSFCNVFCVLFLETCLVHVQFRRNTLVGVTTIGDCQGSGP